MMGIRPQCRLMPRFWSQTASQIKTAKDFTFNLRKMN